MTNRRKQSANTSRSASQPDLAESIRWPDDDGRWLVTAHWAEVNGRPVIVGLDLRSFVDVGLGDGATERTPVGDRMAEVTQRVLRGISISRVRDSTRSRLITRAVESTLAMRSTSIGGALSDLPMSYMDPEEVATLDDLAMERVSRLTAKGEPRKRRPPATDDLLRRVAALYTQAVAEGDTKPAKFVEDRLHEAGEPRLSTSGGRVLVRQWIRRARERGYLTVPPPRAEGR